MARTKPNPPKRPAPMVMTTKAKALVNQAIALQKVTKDVNKLKRSVEKKIYADRNSELADIDGRRVSLIDGNIVRGSGSDEFDGDYLDVTRIDIKLLGVVGSALTPAPFRVMLIWEHENGSLNVGNVIPVGAGQTPTIEHYFENTETKFTVLYDKVHTLQPDKLYQHFNIRKRLKAHKRVQFTTGGVGTGAVVKNNLALYVFGDLAASMTTNPAIQFDYRIYFEM